MEALRTLEETCCIYGYLVTIQKTGWGMSGISFSTSYVVSLLRLHMCFQIMFLAKITSYPALGLHWIPVIIK